MRIEPLAVEPPAFAALIDEIRFKYHKWDAYVGGKLRILPDALVLSQAEHEDAVACCERLHRAIEKCAAAVVADNRLLDRLGIPEVVQEVIRAEIPHSHGIVRYDLIQTASGWMAPEFNEDAPGGFNESIAGRDLFSSLIRHAAVAGDFAATFLDSVPEGRRVGLVYATGYAEDLQHVLILADLLKKRGVEPVLASPGHLRCGRFGRPRLMGKPIDWIFRFFPGEWYGYLENRADWVRAVAKIPVVNPLSRLVRQSKGLYALWREQQLCDEADAAFLNRHTPHTEFFSIGRAQVYLEQREAWVLKKLFGRMGDTVAIGRMCKPDEWEKEVAAAVKTPHAYIAQHAFVPVPVPNATRNLYPALGVYLVNGMFGGYYSRIDEAGFTTHEACYVVTAVETA